MQTQETLDRLIDVLKDSKVEQQVEAVKALGRIGDARAIAILCETALKHRNLDTSREAEKQIRYRKWQPTDIDLLCGLLKEKGYNSAINLFVRGLRNIEDPRVVDSLCDTLDTISGNPSLSYPNLFEIQEALKYFGTRAVARLSVSLKHASSAARAATAETLGRMEDPTGVEPLCGALTDSSPEVRLKAAEALEKMKGIHAVPALIEALQDSTDDVRMAVARTLGKMKDQRAAGPLCALALTNADAGYRARATHLYHDRQDPLKYAIVEIGGSAADELLNAGLKTRDARVRMRAAELLEAVHWELGSDEWRPADVQQRVAYLIAKQKFGETVSYGEVAVELLCAFLDDAHASVRNGVIGALGEIRDSKAVGPICKALLDTDTSVRCQAARALGCIRDHRAVEALIAALKDSDATVRSAAATALGAIKDPRSVPPLLASLKDNNNEVLGNVAKALGEIKDPSAVKPLITALKNRVFEAGEGLAAIGGPAVDALCGALNDRHEDVRKHVVKALRKINDPRGVPSLCAALNDAKESVRREAFYALSLHEDPRAVRSPWHAFPPVPCGPLSVPDDDPRVVDLLIEFLRRDDSDFRVKVSDLLETFLKNAPSTFSTAARKTILHLNISFQYETWELGGAGSPDRNTVHRYSDAHLKELARKVSRSKAGA